MIKFDAAYNMVMDSAFSTGSEEVHFTESAGRILINSVKSDIDMPPFDRSKVDGYACRQADIGKTLLVVEIVAAGMQPQKNIESGMCSRIMTGAALPSGADFVFMFEESEPAGENMVRYCGKSPRCNISYRAEDVISGEVVLKTGCIIRPQEIAIMAMTGCTKILVGKKVRVGIVSTGNELIEPDKKPSATQIRNSNAWQLLAQVERAGGIGKYYGIAADNKESTSKFIETALSENDIVVITGGVSAGDFDLVPGVLDDLGLKMLFDSVAVQPGKPMKLFTGNRKIVFGLPGNPVAAFVQFEVIVRPLIAKMMGATFALSNSINLVLGTDYSRKIADRMAWIPVSLNKLGEVIPLEYHGSGHIASLHEATGLMSVPQGQSWIQKGETVSVRPV
ncbi:MAG TPA: molybdopterin molybdotransferase MoeA [Bacteroidales bacterium]|nr:molybdopterin molybdotransferase MoeA [Bacteroidales bacterium]